MNADHQRQIDALRDEIAELKAGIDAMPSRHAWVTGGEGTGGGGLIPVVLRSIDPAAGKAMAHRIRYIHDPPVVQIEGGTTPTIEAFGDEFQVYPPEGSRLERYVWDKSTRPLIEPPEGEEPEAEKLLYQDFFPFWVFLNQRGRYILVYNWRMPKGIQGIPPGVQSEGNG